MFTPWNTYWDKKEIVSVPGRGDFNTYFLASDTKYFVVCIHGAGHCGLTFSLLAEQLKGKMTICAPDLKCHGETPGDVKADLTMDSMTADMVAFCKAVQPPDTILIVVGHSMGGSVAAHVALTVHMKALIVIDTIEESALDNMDGMKEMLLSRPQSFQNPQDAIEYIASTGEMQNVQSAAVSAGGRFSVDDKGFLYWRPDFMQCEENWKGWFSGFAEAFIGARPYKVLVVPDINRLDKAFTIGHMSGKFQLDVVMGTFHCVHEDNPKAIAEMLLKLMRRIGASSQWD